MAVKIRDKSKYMNVRTDKNASLKMGYLFINDDSTLPTEREGFSMSPCNEGLRSVRFICNVNDRLLSLHKTENDQMTTQTSREKFTEYRVLSCQLAPPFNCGYSGSPGNNFMAFVLHLRHLSSHCETRKVFYTLGLRDHLFWLDSFSVPTAAVTDFILAALRQIEYLRFALDRRKSNELDANYTDLIPVTVDTMFHLLEAFQNNKINLREESLWTLTKLESCVKLMINELPLPLLYYGVDKNVMPADGVANCNEPTTIIQSNQRLLRALTLHLRRLAKHYHDNSSFGLYKLQDIKEELARRMVHLVFRINDTRNIKSAVAVLLRFINSENTC